jgi:rare lipoprotein A
MLQKRNLRLLLNRITERTRVRRNRRSTGVMQPGASKKRIRTGILLLFAGAFAINTSNAQDTTQRKSSNRILYGTASFYSNKFQGRKTANGEIFDQKKMTAACNVLPLGTWIRVTNLRNKRSVIVKINDRLHTKMKRIVDLSRVAATELGYIRSGLTRVKVEVLGKKKPAQ